MTPTVIAIAVAYAVLGTLLLSINVASRLPWQVKLGSIVITGCFFVGAYLATERLLSWPSRGALPARFQVLATHGVEPEHQTGNPGAIYMWVDELDAGNLPLGVPRSFQLPYSFVLAEKTRQAQDAIMSGRRMSGTANEVETSADHSSTPEKPDESRALSGVGNVADATAGAVRIEVDSFLREAQTVDFKDMPAPLLPPKE